MRSHSTVTLLLTAAVLLPVAASAEPGAPVVSQFAPVGEVEALIRGLTVDSAARTKDEAAYKSGRQQLTRDANTLIVLAVALGLHDSPCDLKPRAGAILAAAEKLSQAGSQPEAQEALSQLEGTLQADSAAQAAQPSSWENSAAPDELMKQVAFLQGKIKRGARGSRFASTAEENARWATALAIIARSTAADTAGLEGDEKLAQWREFCGQMQSASVALHQGLAAKDATATATALDRLEQSCTTCHQVFHPDTP